nr:hypothetical protein [Bradyrhizobium sp.]
MQQVGKAVAKQRDVRAHDEAGLRGVIAKNGLHDLLMLGDRRFHAGRAGK